jgi:hypothetical protein
MGQAIQHPTVPDKGEKKHKERVSGLRHIPCKCKITPWCKYFRQGLGKITVMGQAIQHPTVPDKGEKEHKERVSGTFLANVK